MLPLRNDVSRCALSVALRLAIFSEQDLLLHIPGPIQGALHEIGDQRLPTYVTDALLEDAPRKQGMR
jgi:hypothetical protein